VDYEDLQNTVKLLAAVLRTALDLHSGSYG
jgi:hypothetical protein